MEFADIVIPSNETGANKQLPDPYLLNYYEQLDQRIIWVEEEITGTLHEVTKKIIYWNAEDNDKNIPIEKRVPIKLVISSCGGDLYVMLGLIDIIGTSKTPVYTINICQASSAACLLLISGHKRFATPHSTAMWHSGSCGLEGTMEQVQSATKHFDKLDNQLKDYFLKRTSVDLKRYRRQKDKDWYFDAQEQLECGVIDAIIADIGEIV